MTTLTLIFQGPAAQARAALVGLLERYRSAYFVERNATEYAVTTDERTAHELAGLSGWKAQLS